MRRWEAVRKPLPRGPPGLRPRKAQGVDSCSFPLLRPRVILSVSRGRGPVPDVPEPACWPCGRRSRPGTPPPASQVRLSAGTSLHSTETPSAPSSAGLRPAQSISPKGWPHHAQTLPSYHLVRMLRTRQPSGEASIWLRHSCPQPARSGQREHDDSRNSGDLSERRRRRMPRIHHHARRSLVLGTGDHSLAAILPPGVCHAPHGDGPQHHRDRQHHRLNRHTISTIEECNTQANRLSCCF